MTTWPPSPNYVNLSPISPNPSYPGTPLTHDPSALHSRIDTLQAELNTTNSVNANLAGSVNRLQAELDTTSSVNTNLAASVNRLQAELNTTTSVNTNLAASVTRLQLELENVTTAITQLAVSVTRLQAEQATPTPTTTTTTTTTPTMPSTPTATTVPLQFPCGRGAASPEVFLDIMKTNWHGRLGRAHMVDVDALPVSALMELDSLLRRKLHAIFPRGKGYSLPDADTIFASLAALGLRLEDRGGYVDVPETPDSALRGAPMVRRGREFVAWYYRGKYVDYWRGFAVETLIELARYRGLFDDEGYLRVD